MIENGPVLNKGAKITLLKQKLVDISEGRKAYNLVQAQYLAQEELTIEEKYDELVSLSPYLLPTTEKQVAVKYYEKAFREDASFYSSLSHNIKSVDPTLYNFLHIYIIIKIRISSCINIEEGNDPNFSEYPALTELCRLYENAGIQDLETYLKILNYFSFEEVNNAQNILVYNKFLRNIQETQEFKKQQNRVLDIINNTYQMLMPYLFDLSPTEKLKGLIAQYHNFNQIFQSLRHSADRLSKKRKCMQVKIHSGVDEKGQAKEISAYAREVLTDVFDTLKHEACILLAALSSLEQELEQHHKKVLDAVKAHKEKRKKNKNKKERLRLKMESKDALKDNITLEPTQTEGVDNEISLKLKTLTLYDAQREAGNANASPLNRGKGLQERIQEGIINFESQQNPRWKNIHNLISKLNGSIVSCGSGSNHYKVTINNTVGYFCHRHNPGHSENGISNLAKKHIQSTFQRAGIYSQYQIEMNDNFVAPSNARRYIRLQS